MKKLILGALAATTVALPLAAAAFAAPANASTVNSTDPTCVPVIEHTEYKWVPDVVNAGPTMWTLDNAAPNTKKPFNWKGVNVWYHRDGTKSQLINGVNCGVAAPVFSYSPQTCSVTIPYTEGLETRLYGVNGYSQDVAITHDVSVSAGLDGADGTAPQFWIGYTAKPGYYLTGTGTTHIDFYNGDYIPDCDA